MRSRDFFHEKFDRPRAAGPVGDFFTLTIQSLYGSVFLSLPCDSLS
jgi:hypothetical protein